MKIESIKVKNFKALQDFSLENIPSLCLIVGSNGSGKTTIFDVFGFLKDCLTFNVTRAIQSRGGFNEMVSRGQKDQDITFEIQYRMEITGKERLVTYILEICLVDNKPCIKREILRYKRGAYGSPFHFLDFSMGKGYAITNEEDFSKPDEDLNREEQKVSLDNLAIKGLGQFQRFKAANKFRELIEGWHVSDFHINLARGSKDAAGFGDHLSVTGDNLQNVARNLYDNDQVRFTAILEKMKKRVPGIGAITPEITQDGRLLLKFQDGSFKDPFIDRYVSDGTIKMFAYLLLLHDSAPFPLLCIEEPENQLYPKLLGELLEEFRDYARRGGQVFVSTHSPDLLNAARLEEVCWLEKQNGYTHIHRAADDEQVRKYVEEGDKLGYLWKEGFFAGADPQ
ncbi:MAG TPA: AAA family ATPase [bacterium]|nr:AAA family ATPase [bacterium]HPN42705.1 AAA family ATPase [bacterium]